MSNTQTISGQGRLPGFFTNENIAYLQQQISDEIATFYKASKVLVPAENIEGVMIHTHESWGPRMMILKDVNSVVVSEIVSMFKSHLNTQQTSDYLLNNEYEFRTRIRSMDTYRMNPRARSVQFQNTF